jgi:hypothetical protein
MLVNSYLFTDAYVAELFRLRAPQSEPKRHLGINQQWLIRLQNSRQTQNHTSIRQPNSPNRSSQTRHNTPRSRPSQRPPSNQTLPSTSHPALKRKAIITYTTSHGLKVWYWHDNPEEVTDPAFLNQTRQYLIDIAKERGIEIENAAEIHPAKLAHVIFSKLIPELRS